MNFSVLAVTDSAPVGPMWVDCAATPVLLSTTGIPLDRDASNVSAILLALLAGTVMIRGSAHVRPTLVGCDVISVLLATMAF